MANPLERRKNLLDDTDYKSKFNYKEFEVKNIDEEYLVNLEQKIKTSQVIFIKANLEIGSLLSEAQEKLKNYGTGTFMKWYENLGFNKDNVSYFLKRYDLSLEYPNKREYIAEMPVRLVKELTKKDVEKDFLDEVIKEEVKSTKELNAIKISYSHGANIESTKISKAFVEKQEIFEYLKNRLSNTVSDEKINEIVKEMFDVYRFNRK